MSYEGFQNIFPRAQENVMHKFLHRRENGCLTATSLAYGKGELASRLSLAYCRLIGEISLNLVALSYSTDVAL
jgi:hypothetical protein